VNDSRGDDSAQVFVAGWANTHLLVIHCSFRDLHTQPMAQALKMQPARTTHAAANVSSPNGTEANGTILTVPKGQFFLHDPVIHRSQV